MKKSLLLTFVILLFLCISDGASAQESRLLRNPAMSDDKIAFLYAGDVWTANHDGSDALRITTFEGVESDPHFSPDGNHIAFTGQYDGNTDVYIVPVEGGEPKRLTWHPDPDLVRGWTLDGKQVLFASGRTRVPYAFPDQLWTVSVSGTTPTRFVLPRAIDGKFAPDESKFVYEEILPWENEFRNYRGGQNSPLKIFDLNSFAIEKMPWDNSKDMSPVWIGEQIYFLSDRDNAMNIWVYHTKTKDVLQVTHFKDFDCKSLEGNGGKLIFENAGYLYSLKVGTDTPEKLSVSITGDFKWARPHWVNVSKYIGNAAISPSGKRVAISARGDVFTLPAKKGNYRNLTSSSGVADRAVAWSPNGEFISWFSDEGGEYQIVISDQYGKNKKKISIENPTFFYKPSWSPDSKYISFYNENRTLWILEVSSGKLTKIDNEGFAHPEHVIYGEWAPDSKWLSYTKRLSNEYAAIFIYSIEQNKCFQITDGMSDCKMPAWDESGKYLYFTSSIDYGMNVGWLDMSSFDHPVKRSVFVVVLSKDDKSPLAPESDEEEIKKEEKSESVGKEKKKNKKSGDSESQDEEDKIEVKIDFEGLQSRIISLPIPAKNYQQLESAKEGVILYSELEPQNSSLTLHRFTLEKRKSEEVVDGIKYFEIAADKSKYLYVTGNNQFVVSDPSAAPNLEEETVSLNDVMIYIDPAKEWEQIFREAWRFQRDYFYVDNVHGLDLEWAYNTYAPWVKHVKHRSDLNYVLDVFGGETSIGHSFVGGGDFPEVPRIPVGLLGVDVNVENGKFRVKKIYSGESWNSSVEAPLSGPGINVKVGDYLLAVNGMPLEASINFYAAFDQTADKQIFLSVNSEPSLEGAQELTVIPVKSEAALRQYDWIESNRRKVDELSGGKLAYVWLPNTTTAGYEHFNRYYFAQKNKKGAVIDERFNQGGSIADYIVDLLSRELLGYFNNPIGERQPFTAPNAGIWGPKVMIINELAGSGGDMLPYMFKMRKLGPLVGTKTWGGLVGIWDVPALIDGGRITAPRGGFYNIDGEWDVENIGVPPDILVEQEPKLIIEGHDPQLEKAVTIALDLLEKEEVILKPQPKDPVRVIRPE